MSETPLKDRLLANGFARRLRSEGAIDDAEWTQFRIDLRELVAVWSNRTEIDKELAGVIVHNLLTIVGMLETFERVGADQLRDDLSERLMEFYSLVDDLFQDTDR